MQKEFPAFQFSFLSLFIRKMSQTQQTRYDKSNDCPLAKMVQSSDFALPSNEVIRKVKSLSIFHFPNINRLDLVGRKTTCCVIRRMCSSWYLELEIFFRAGTWNRIESAPDRWSQNINLWTWFSLLFRSGSWTILESCAKSWRNIHKASIFRKRKANEMKFYWYWTRALTKRRKRKIYPVKNY